ncbi:MAG TPA: hypothetical protein VFQ61_23910, partial [Polyangiaceae bacterium]|nr:hypothetical protein [Polyangiaceae bacterium]
GASSGGSDAQGAGGRASGGRSSTPLQGGANVGGASASNGGSAAAGSASGNTAQPSQGGSSGMTNTEPEPPAALQICKRLDNVTMLSANVTKQFMGRILDDCAIGLLYEEYFSAPSLLANRILQWNLPLWGCTEAATSFDLAPDSAQLSRGDATRLIEHYLASAKPILDLGSTEQRDLKGMLEYLANKRIVDQSDQPSRPCDLVGAGGNGSDEGGSGNMESGEGGAPGTP